MSPGPGTSLGPLALRPARDDDEDLLRRIFANTREPEMALVPWDDAQKAAFLRMQFDAQHRYYHEQFPHTAFDLIVRGDQPIGRLYVDRRDTEIRIIDIAILPEHRGLGIGTRLLSGLIEEATRAGKLLTLHVDQANPARSLYLRLGFVSIAIDGIHELMERRPDLARDLNDLVPSPGLPSESMD